VFKVEARDGAGNLANSGTPPTVTASYKAAAASPIAISGLTATQSGVGQSITGSFSVSGSTVSLVRVHAGTSASSSACYTDLGTSVGAKSFSFSGAWTSENGLSCASLLPSPGGTSSIVFKVEARDGAGNLANGGTPPTVTASYTLGTFYVDYLTTTSFTRGQWMTVTVIGGNVPSTAVLAIADAICGYPYGYTYAGFKQDCNPQVSGYKSILVKDRPGGTVYYSNSIFIN
jgi:uncharacterized membrane protein (DUF485 family)